MKSESPQADEDKSEMRVLSGDDISSVSGGDIQMAIQAYQAWMTLAKSLADSKGEVQKQLARFG